MFCSKCLSPAPGLSGVQCLSKCKRERLPHRSSTKTIRWMELQRGGYYVVRFRVVPGSTFGPDPSGHFRTPVHQMTLNMVTPHRSSLTIMKSSNLSQNNLRYLLRSGYDSTFREITKTRFVSDQSIFVAISRNNQTIDSNALGSFARLSDNNSITSRVRISNFGTHPLPYEVGRPPQKT